MSRLGDLEDNIVQRIAQTLVSGSPLMATARGASGSFRAAMKAAMLRERMPAAYVCFIHEQTAPEAKAAQRGPRFAIVLAAQALRITSDPRHGDTDSRGVYAIVDSLRARLDYYQPNSSDRMQTAEVRYLDADDRTVFYELLYRVAPIAGALLFNGDPLGSSQSVTLRSLGPADPLPWAELVPDTKGQYVINGISPDDLPSSDISGLVQWRGEFRAATLSALNDQLTGLATLVSERSAGTLEEPGVAQYTSVSAARFSALGPSFVDLRTGEYVQPVEVLFSQAVEE